MQRRFQCYGPRLRLTLCAFVLFGVLAWSGFRVSADDVKTVFVIAMENHNWTQPANQFTGGIQQIYQNPGAPYINSLVDGTSGISEHVAYAVAYHNVLATPAGNNPHIHPSEPNYLWAEAGTNFGVLNDNDPFGTNGTNQNTTQHLVTQLTAAGRTWRSYQEDTDVVVNNGLRFERASGAEPLDRATVQLFRRPPIRSRSSTRRCSSWRTISRTARSPTTTGSRRTSSTTCTRGSPADSRG